MHYSQQSKFRIVRTAHHVSFHVGGDILVFKEELADDGKSNP